MIAAAALVLAAAAVGVASGGRGERWAAGLWRFLGLNPAGEPVAVSEPTLSELDLSGKRGDLPLRVLSGTKASTPGALNELTVTGGGGQDTFSFKAYRISVDGKTSLVVPTQEGPALLKCPGRELYIFAAANSLWSLDLSGKVAELTPGTAGPYDRSATLAPGTGPLLWALDPMPSPDGTSLAYHSNREAVFSGTAGQSLWMCNLETGEQTQVLCQPGAGYRAHGWLGPGSLVITDENRSGYGVLDIQSGEIAWSGKPGEPIAVISQTGTIVASVPDAEPAGFRFVAAGADGQFRDVVVAPQGYRLVQFALPSPEGDSLLIKLWEPDGPGLLGVVNLERRAVIDTWPPPQGYQFDGPFAWVGGSAVIYGATDFRTRTSETLIHFLPGGGASK